MLYLPKHERVIEFEAPGDVSPTPRDLIRLDGTQSSWDQTYYVERISRRFSFEEGFKMTVRAKNHSAQSQVELQ